MATIKYKETLWNSFSLETKEKKRLCYMRKENTNIRKNRRENILHIIRWSLVLRFVGESANMAYI